MDVNLFHEHLDHCRRCQQNPMDLCHLGGRLLQLTSRLIHDENFGIDKNDPRSAKRDPLYILAKEVGPKKLIDIETQLGTERHRENVLGTLGLSPSEERVMRSLAAEPGPIGELMRAVTTFR